MKNQEIPSLGYLIHDVARLLKRRFASSVRDHGLTLPQWRLLAQLKRAGDMSQASLANLIDSDPMTVSRMAERLEAAGLVTRLPDPNDSRAKLVRLTETSLKMFEELRPVSIAVYHEALEGISQDERDALLSALERMQSNLNALQATESDVVE